MSRKKYQRYDETLFNIFISWSRIRKPRAYFPEIFPHFSFMTSYLQISRIYPNLKELINLKTATLSTLILKYTITRDDRTRIRNIWKRLIKHPTLFLYSATVHVYFFEELQRMIGLTTQGFKFRRVRGKKSRRCCFRWEIGGLPARVALILVAG